MARPNFPAVALAAAAALLASDARAFSLSSISSLLSRVGVDVTLPDRTITLPARAEEAVQRALSRAESVLDDLFDDEDGIDLPEIDIDQIVSDALERAQSRIDEALSRAQSRIDSALDRARSVLDDLDLADLDLADLDLPSIDLPEIDLPEIDLGNLDVQGIVDDALDTAQEAVDGAQGILDELLEDEASVSGLLSRLPPVAVQAIQSAGLSATFASLANEAAPVGAGVPEPTALVLAAPLLAAGFRRRR